MKQHTLHLFRFRQNGKYALLLLLCTAINSTGFTLSREQLDITRTTVHGIISNNYESVLTMLGSHANASDDPLYPLLLLATIGMRDVDFEKTVDSSLFLSTFSTTLAAIGNWEAVHGVNSYSQTLSGMSRVMHSIFYLRQKRYIAALQYGTDGIGLLRKAQECAPSNTEVDFFLGLYEYGRAELRSRLWWVLFWYPGSRRNGIERVERCARTAVMTAQAAKLSLCDIYVQEKRFADAKAVLDQLKKDFPESRFVLWAEVKYFEAQDDLLTAASLYGRLAASYGNDSHGDYNALFTGTRQAALLCKAGLTDEATERCRRLLGNPTIKNYRELERETTKLMERCHAARRR